MPTRAAKGHRCGTLLPVWEETDREGLRARAGGHAFLRWTTGPTAVGVVGHHGWAVLTPWRPGGRHWGGLAVVAEDAPEDAETSALVALADLVRGRGASPEWFSTAPGRTLAPPPGYALEGEGVWDLLWTTAEPVPVGGSPDVAPAPHDVGPAPRRGLPCHDLVELDDREDAAEIEEFGRRHNPTFEGLPGRGYAELWLGARGAGGGLTAVGAVHRLASGVPHLAGIVVDPARRRAGLGTALTVELTRWSLRSHGVSTLGVYSDHADALRLYDRLGYRFGQRLHTRGLTRRP